MSNESNENDCVYDDESASEYFELDGRFWTVSVDCVSQGNYSVTISVKYVVPGNGLTSSSIEVDCEGSSADAVAHQIAGDIRDGEWNEMLLSE